MYNAQNNKKILQSWWWWFILVVLYYPWISKIENLTNFLNLKSSFLKPSLIDNSLRFKRFLSSLFNGLDKQEGNSFFLSLLFSFPCWLAGWARELLLQSLSWASNQTVAAATADRSTYGPNAFRPFHWFHHSLCSGTSLQARSRLLYTSSQPTSLSCLCHPWSEISSTVQSWNALERNILTDQGISAKNPGTVDIPLGFESTVFLPGYFYRVL